MNRLSTAERVQILSALVEGNSLRATSRMVGVSINTVTKLLVDLGKACATYQGGAMQNLPCQRLQVDEIWAFCYSKQKNVPEEMKGQFGVGDVWTWAAICADTKLIPTWFTGDRGAGSARELMQDLAPRLARRVQLTTEGYKVYLEAVDEAFRGQVDYAQLVKIYGRDESEPETPYSPAKCNGAKKEPRIGNPDPDHISTSYVERQNLTMRMSMRRFTRLTNGFSKKVENHAHAIAIHFMHYNFGRVHKTLKTTPAIAAGLSNHVWSLAEIVGLLD
ncbi:MAG: IS1 family transposase [Bryobacterales bacterium]